MANTGYGKERYGRSLYGQLTYHDLEAVVQASASISTQANFNFGLTNEQINAVASLSSTGNATFGSFGCAINSSSSTSSSGQRLAIAVPNELIQNSGHLVHATQVDQPETFILVQPTIASIGTQIDLIVSAPITVNSSSDVVGIQIDLAESSMTANTSTTSIGTQIDLAEVNPIATTVSTAVATQIDLGAVTSCNAKALVTTLNPIFNTLNKAVSISNGNLEIDGSSAIVEVPVNFNINYDLSDSSLSGKTLGLSRIPYGINNTTLTHISAKTDSNGNEYLQLSGASAVTTAGGVATSSLRTLYKFQADTSSTPSYTGTGWAYVYVQNAVTVDDGINVSIGYQLVSGFNILTIGGRPVYQFIGDTSHDTANGSAVSGWEAIDKSGNSQTSVKSTTADDTLIASGIGATKTGTEGSSGSQISINSATDLTAYLYEYLDSSTLLMQTNFSLGSGSLETVSLLVGSAEVESFSEVIPFAHRRYFLETNIPSLSSISIDGRLKWSKQNVPDTSWTEQKLQKTN